MQRPTSRSTPQPTSIELVSLRLEHIETRLASLEKMCFVALEAAMKGSPTVKETVVPVHQEGGGNITEDAQHRRGKPEADRVRRAIS
jgi:hypothetical protein